MEMNVTREELYMSERNIDISDMQCWVFQMAQKRWGKSPVECAAIFEKNDVLGFISRCYDMLHLSSYEEAFYRFVKSPAYEDLFDYSTGLWREGPDYLRERFLERS